MITLRQFEIFVEAVRAGSFRRCAQQLGMSAVAVSEHVRALEAEIGTPLFERRSGLLPTPTAAGALVHERATTILADVADLRCVLRGSGAAGRRTISIAVHTYLMRDLPQELALFRDAWPQIDLNIDLSLATHADFLERVAHRKLDVAYCFGLHPDDVPGSAHIRDERLGVYVGRGHPLATQSVVTVQELAAEPAIQLAATEPLTILIDRIFAGLGATGRRVGLVTDQFHLIVASVRHNQGYACLFESSIEGDGETQGLVRLVLDVTLPPLQVRRLSRRSVEADRVLVDICTRIERRLQTN